MRHSMDQCITAHVSFSNENWRFLRLVICGRCMKCKLLLLHAPRQSPSMDQVYTAPAYMMAGHSKFPPFSSVALKMLLTMRLLMPLNACERNQSSVVPFNHAAY